MEITGLRRTTSALVGRERECAEIDGLIENAIGGESAPLVVRGEAGIGKTALLQYAADRADEMTVLRATGVEAESDLAFGGLYGLVRPILSLLDELPETQSDALAGALGLAPSAGSDRFLVSAAVLGLLAAAGEQRPILCLIDDAQWLDRPSADALVFAARRFRADPVAMVFGAREGELRRFDTPGLPELVLTGLDERSAAAVLGRHAHEAVAAVRARLLAEAAGNPLALMELPAGLSDQQLAGKVPLPEAMPLTPRLQALFRERIERLPEATQTGLLIAAAEDACDLATVLRAVDQLELGRDALDPAERVDLLRVVGGRIEFRHPLVRSALYEGATTNRRRLAHAALANALSGEEQSDRRVWHQAMATLSADEEVAAALEASARRSQLRAAHASAATAFLRASELSADEERRAVRMGAAAQAAWNAGQPDQARDAIAQVLPEATGQLRAELLYLGGVIEARCGSIQTALRLLLEAADASIDPSGQLEALGEAAEAASFSGEFEQAIELGRRAARIKPQTDRDEFLVALLSGLAAVAAGDHDRGSQALRDVLVRAPRLEDPRGLIWAASAIWAAPELGDALDFAVRAVELARQRGLVSLLPLALHYQATALLARSRFDLALAAAEEGHRLAQDTGQVWAVSWHLASMASVEGIRGRLEVAREHAKQVLAAGRSRDAPFLIGVGNWRLGQIALVSGQFDEATDHLLAATATDTQQAQPMVALRVIPDLIEAAVAAGRQADVTERVERYRDWVTQWPTSLHIALYSRCRALLEPAAADEHFRAALSTPEVMPPYWRARTELLYGEWLRRDRQRLEARRHLRLALDLFRQVGAVLWEERAASELRATGERARKRDASTLDELTPQELQIAGLVAEGLTNKDIAGQMFLSPRTVDYHLRKVFTKLGIASRGELIRQRPVPSP